MTRPEADLDVGDRAAAGAAGETQPTPDPLLEAIAAVRTAHEKLESLRDSGPPQRTRIPISRIYTPRGLWLRLRVWSRKRRSPLQRAVSSVTHRAGPVGRRLYNQVSGLMTEGVLLLAALLSFCIVVLTITAPLTGVSLFSSVPPEQRPLVAVLASIFVVALAGLHAELRFLRMLREESECIVQLNEMDEHYARLARDGIGFYYEVVRNLRYRPRLGSVKVGGYYRDVAEVELNAHRETLHRLARGLYSAPEEQVDRLMRAVLDPFTTYAAVSHHDIGYWLREDSNAKKYRSHLETAARKGKVMRIFIVSMEDLRDDWNRILGILDYHERTNVKWALAVEERLDRSISLLWRSSIAPALPEVRPETFDFAVVNGGEVVTFFTQDAGRSRRDLLSVFNVPEQQKVLSACGSMFARLLSEVWIVSESFSRDWRSFLPAAVDDRLRSDFHDGGAAGFVEHCDQRWKESRQKTIRARENLVRAMGLDPEFVLQLCTPRPGIPFEVVHSGERTLAEDMDRFRHVLKADVLAVGRLSEIEALCGPDEVARYHALTT